MFPSSCLNDADCCHHNTNPDASEGMLTHKQLGHLLQKCNKCNMKLIPLNKYSVSTVATDGLVLKHQGISSQSAEYAPRGYAPMQLRLFMG